MIFDSSPAASDSSQYAYDTEDNLLSITDANGHATNFSYDQFGCVTTTNFPSTLSESYAYDADDNLTSKTDRKGHTIQYDFVGACPERSRGNALNRLTQKLYPD